MLFLLGFLCILRAQTAPSAAATAICTTVTAWETKARHAAAVPRTTATIGANQISITVTTNKALSGNGTLQAASICG
jgi:hypothetical protein